MAKAIAVASISVKAVERAFQCAVKADSFLKFPEGPRSNPTALDLQ